MEVKLHRQKENSFQAKVMKTVDRLQSKYGVPPSSRENAAEDLIVSEFASIWDNILSFQHNVLKVDSDKKSTTSLNPLQKKINSKKHDDRSKIKKTSVQAKLKHRTVILESRPYKFKSWDKKCKSRKLKQPDRYEPMTDVELANALNLDVEEVKEFFEYANDNASETVCLDAFDEEGRSLL